MQYLACDGVTIVIVLIGRCLPSGDWPNNGDGAEKGGNKDVTAPIMDHRGIPLKYFCLLRDRFS
jgi:hypothetical protein